MTQYEPTNWKKCARCGMPQPPEQLVSAFEAKATGSLRLVHVCNEKAPGPHLPNRCARWQKERKP